jgi:hypothetical protein
MHQHVHSKGNSNERPNPRQGLSPSSWIDLWAQDKPRHDLLCSYLLPICIGERPNEPPRQPWSGFVVVLRSASLESRALSTTVLPFSFPRSSRRVTNTITNRWIINPRITNPHDYQSGSLIKCDLWVCALSWYGSDTKSLCFFKFSREQSWSDEATCGW